MKRLVAALITTMTLAAACTQAALAQRPICPSYDDYNRAEQRCTTHHEHGEAH